MRIFDGFQTGAKTAFLVLALAPCGFAQMHGGMMGGGWGSGGMYNGMMGAGSPGGMMGGVLGGMMGGMMGGGMGSTVWGPAVGTDGTAYIVRQSARGANVSPSQIAVSSELVAIDRNGKQLWAAPVEGPLVSQPALGPDNRIFLTVSGHNLGFGGLAGPSKLVIFSPAGVKIQAVAVNADVLSVPKVVPDGSGYAVYVTASDMGFMGWMWNFGGQGGQRPAGGSDLHAFTPDGALKFSVPLSRWQFSYGR